MPSIFSGPATLRSQYYDMAAATVTGTSLATSVLLCCLKNESNWITIYNGTNGDIYIALVNPRDPDSTKLDWTVLQQGQSFNLDALSGRMLTFPAMTKIYLHTATGAVTTGKVRLLVWG